MIIIIIIITTTLGSCQRAAKAVEQEDDSDNNYSWRTKNIPQGLGEKKRLEELEIRKKIETLHITVL